MIFTDIFIKRPVFATALSLMILVVGIASLAKLDVRLYPKIDTPVINVRIIYPGANSSLMESFVTTPVENAISSVEGIDYIASTSTQNTSNIDVTMKPGFNLDTALINVSNKVSSVRWQLPQEVQDPVVSKSEMGGTATAALYLNFASSSMNPEEVTDYLLRVVQPQLQMQPGVSDANVLGERRYAMRMWLDPNLMAAHNVTANEIAQAIRSNNVQSAAGQLKGKLQQYVVYANTDLSTQKEFNDIIIRSNNGQIVRMKDVGKAELGAEDTEFSIFTKHAQTTFMEIMPKSDANPLNVVKAIKKALPDIKKHLPQDTLS